MTPLKQLETRASEIRIRLSELGDTPDLTDETRSEIDNLRREYQDNERKQTALRIAGDNPPTPLETRSSEGREFRTAVQAANLGEIFAHVAGVGNVTGATAELQQHYGLETRMIPAAMLIQDWAQVDKDLETRAVTPAPSNVGQNQGEIWSYVFPTAAAAFLGVEMPTVGVGEAVYPVLTSELTVGTPAENAAQAETTGSFSADVLSPSRIQAAFFFSREDRARFAGMSEALRRNLNDGLGDGHDKQILAGTNGLLTGTNLPNANVSTADTFATYMSNFAYKQVDGRYCDTTGQLAIVVGSDTYADMGATYRSAESDMNALDRLMAVTSGVRVSAHVPDTASNKQNAVIRRGMEPAAVSPIWEGIELIPDEITKADQGQIKITAVMLYAMKVIRTGGSLVKQQAQHS